MERELAKTLREQLAKAESKGTGTGEENGDKATDQISMQSRALLARIETTEEALRSIGRLPDADAGEVSERINAFVEEQEYLETIGASREVAESDSESLAADRDAMRQAAEQAQQRAKDLADAAIQLETIYRSLVAPKLETLRELEMRADELRKAMEETGDEITPEQSLAFQDLALQLSNIGMSGLANILLGGDGPGSVGDGTELPVGQLRLVMEAMRARIQEMILFEAAADRETPIPTEYRELVDRYFRALSGETLQDDR